MTTGMSAGFGPETATASGPRADGAASADTASLGDLVANISHDLTTLLHQEVQLAKAEIKAEAVKTGKGAGMLGGSGFAGYMTLLFLSLALLWGLANVMDAGWSALIVAALWAAVGAGLFASGRAKLRQVHPTPERTVETAKQVPSALRGEAS